MAEKPSLPKNRRVTLEDSYKNKTRRKSKETLEEEKNNHDFSQRERDLEPERKFLNLEIKEITNFYSSFERRKPTNSSHCDLLST